MVGRARAIEEKRDQLYLVILFVPAECEDGTHTAVELLLLLSSSARKNLHGFTFRDLLDKAVVTDHRSLLFPSPSVLAFIFIAHRLQHSRFSAFCADFYGILALATSRSRAFRSSHFTQQKIRTITSTSMHSVRLEPTTLTIVGRGYIHTLLHQVRRPIASYLVYTFTCYSIRYADSLLHISDKKCDQQLKHSTSTSKLLMIGRPSPLRFEHMLW